VERAAVVIGRGGQRRQIGDHMLAARCGDVAARGESADAIVCRGARDRVVHVHERAGREAEIHFDAEQAALTVRIDGERHERLRQQRTALHDP